MDYEKANLITAIIPLTSDTDRVHNVCEIISSCQSLPITLIVVFDSQDKIPTSLLDVIERCSTTILITQGFWKNPGESRNAGLSMVSTKWVIFWDSDDIPFPIAVLEMIRIADAEKADCCVGGFELENQHTTEIFTPEKNNWVDSALVYPGLWRFAFESSIIQDKKFSNYRMGEDQEFLARALSSSKKIYVTKKSVYKYRTGATTQLTKSYSDFTELLYVFDSLSLLEKAFTADATRLIGVMKAKIALTALKKGSRNVKLKMFLKMSGRLINLRSFSSGEIGNGLLVSILEKIKRGSRG